jgi:hypothetical protein
MPTFSTQYILTNGAIAAGTALANVEYIAGALKTYPNTTHLNFSASNFPDRFTEGQIVYVSASNELFKMGKYFDDQITFADVVTSQSFEFPGGSIPAGTISGSPQIAAFGYLTSASAAAAGFGSGGGTATDISALNTFTGSIQIQVNNLTSATSSYLTSASTGSFILASQTSSMSVLNALTASFISSTFISASAAASGFGSGGGSINTGSFATTGSNTFKGEQIISSSLIVTNEIKGTNSIFLQPDVNDGRKLEIYNTAATDVHIKSNGGLTFLGDDTNYVLVDNSAAQTVSITGVNGVFVNSSLNVSGSLIVTGSINVPGSVINNLTSSFATTASFISDLFISASAVRSGFGTALFPSGLLSSSFQIANDISGAFTSLSSSFASRITTLEGAGGGNGIFTLTGSFYSTTNNIQITGSLSVGSGSFKSFEVNSDGFVVLGDMNKDLNNAPEGTIAYSGSNFYLIS